MKIINKKTNDYYNFSKEAIQIVQAEEFVEIIKCIEMLTKSGTSLVLEDLDLEYQYSKQEIEILNYNTIPPKIDTSNKILSKYLLEVIRENEIMFSSLLRMREFKNEMETDIGLIKLNSKLQENINNSIRLEMQDVTIENFIKNLEINFEETIELKKWYINVFLEYFIDKKCIILIDQRITEEEYAFLEEKTKKYNLIVIINNEKQILKNIYSVHYLVKNKKLVTKYISDLNIISYAIKYNTKYNMEYQQEIVKKISKEVELLDENTIFYQESLNLHSKNIVKKSLN